MDKIFFSLIILSIGCNQPSRQVKDSVQTHAVKEIVLEGLKHPWSIAFLSENEALISEKDGNIVKVNLSTKSKKIVKGFPKDLTDSIRVKYRGDNSGIFEVLLDPEFHQNRFIYISYAAKRVDEGTTTKVIRATFKNDSLSQIKTILEATPYTKEYYHYGGGMCFGSDHKLYITVGERLFREIDEPPLPIAQDVSDKRGKIYRLNTDGSIPMDNPDFGKEAQPGIYAIGIRAAQGITKHPQTGKIWFSEHGTRQGDELNILESGANYGWPIITTGGYRSEDYQPPSIPDAVYKDPKWFWSHTVAPTGLIFYKGQEFQEWNNDLLVSGLSKGSLWRFRIENDTIKNAEELFVNDRVRSRKIAQSPEGKLYLLTDELNGKIIRIKNQSKSINYE